MATKAVGFPDLSRITAAEDSPAKHVPSFRTNVYSTSRMMPSSMVFRRCEKPLVVFGSEEVERISSQSSSTRWEPYISRAARGQCNMPFRVEHDHRIGRRFHEHPVLFFALSQSVLGGLAFRDVGHHNGPAKGPSLLIAEKEIVMQGGGSFAFPGDDRHFPFPVSFSLQGRYGLSPPLPRFFGIRVQEELADDIVRLFYVNQPTHRRIDVGDAAFEIADAETLTGCVGKLLEEEEFSLALVSSAVLSSTRAPTRRGPFEPSPRPASVCRCPISGR